MDYFDAEKLKQMFDLFLLNRFSDGPLSLPEIQRRHKLIYAFRDRIAAARNLKQDLGTSLTGDLQRLQHAGWLKAERPAGDETEMLYSLTLLGAQRVAAERARQESMLSQFVEDSELDKSFRNFWIAGIHFTAIKQNSMS